MRFLVTGGAGFIGSHLCERLLAEGGEVTVLDNLNTGFRENVPPEARFIEGDVGDAEAVRSAFAGGRFDAVLHVAAQASVSVSFSSPERDLVSNVTGTLNVLRACVASGVPRLVYASSMTVYGEPDELPTPETAACRPLSFYGLTKYAAERYVQITGALPSAELAVTSLRMFNVYGARQSVSNPYQGVLAIFIGNVLRGEPLTIHSDGRQTRDFVYIDDVVDAWMRVLDQPATHGRVYNVGSGHETSVNELADSVLAVFGYSREDWEIGFAEAQQGDQRRSAADVGALAEAIGWQPMTRLEDGMRRTIEWARGAAQGSVPGKL